MRPTDMPGPTPAPPPTSPPASPDFLERNLRMLEHLERVKHVVVVMSGKGGVGKTTVAVNTAVALAKHGRKVGLLDLDITNPNAPRMLGLETYQFEGAPPFEPGEAHGVKVASTSFFLRPDQAVIWRGPIKVKMIRELIGSVAWGELDVLVIDLPPGTSDEPLSVAQMIPKKSGAVLVTTPQTVSVDDVRRNVGFARRVNMPILGVVENMAGFMCESCGHMHHIFGEGGGQSIADEAKVPLLASIPLDPRVVTGGDTGAPVMVHTSSGPVADAFATLVKNVEQALDTRERES